MAKQNTIDIEYGSGMLVSARMGDTIIKTDQSVDEGGTGSAPTPFALFLASLTTCAALYAKRFCESRNLSTEGLALSATCTYADKEFHLDRIDYHLTLPKDFPPKYHEAILRSVNLCTVKKHLINPPEISVEVVG